MGCPYRIRGAGVCPATLGVGLAVKHVHSQLGHLLLARVSAGRAEPHHNLVAALASAPMGAPHGFGWEIQDKGVSVHPKNHPTWSTPCLEKWVSRVGALGNPHFPSSGEPPFPILGGNATTTPNGDRSLGMTSPSEPGTTCHPWSPRRGHVGGCPPPEGGVLTSGGVSTSSRGVPSPSHPKNLAMAQRSSRAQQLQDTMMMVGVSCGEKGVQGAP